MTQNLSNTVIDNAEKLLKRKNFTVAEFRTYMQDANNLAKMGGRRLSIKYSQGSGVIFDRTITARFEYFDTTRKDWHIYFIDDFLSDVVIRDFITFDRDSLTDPINETTQTLNFDTKTYDEKTKDITNDIQHITIYFDGYEDAKVI